MNSIEWLKQKLQNESLIDMADDIFEQAKEMHKQEIIDAHLTGLIREIDIEATKQANEYYSETFGSKGSGVLTDGSGAVSNIGGAVELTLQDHVPDVREMVEDDVEKLAEERFPIRNECALDIIDLLKIKQDIYIECYNKAKETLYTEGQIMEAMLQISEYYADNLGKEIDGHKKALEIIQSLKQNK